jgi:hypothetical protein
MNTPSTTELRTVKWLIGAYLALSTLTVAAIITLSAEAPRLVTPQALVRGVIVAATSFLSFRFATRAARGDTRALLRLRIVVAILSVAVVAVLLFVPLPPWMVVEQVACGVLLAAAAVVILRPRRTPAAR